MNPFHRRPPSATPRTDVMNPFHRRPPSATPRTWPLLAGLLLAPATLALAANVQEELKGQFAAVRVVTDAKVSQPQQNARRGTKRVAFVKVIGCAGDADGRCNIETEYRIYRPDGRLDGRIAPSLPWREMAPPPGEAVLSAPPLGFSMAAEDPVGRYRIEATVNDRVSGQHIDVSQPIDISK